MKNSSKRAETKKRGKLREAGFASQVVNKFTRMNVLRDQASFENLGEMLN